MPLGWIITCDIWSIRPPSGQHLPAFPFGCGATTRYGHLSTGFAHHNASVKTAARVAFHGLDLYSLYDSIRAVLKYLDRVDPATAQVARERYGCLTPWQSDPATYGHAALTGAYPTCEADVAVVLTDLLQKHREYAERDGEHFMDAVQNARLIANAERYYRIMYYGSRASWNLRDSHMFETLKTLLAFYGPSSKAVVWAHNSHIGNAAATEMFSRGEYNLGHLCRKQFGNSPMPSASAPIAARSRRRRAGTARWRSRRSCLRCPESYESICHESGKRSFLLDLRQSALTPRACANHGWNARSA